MNYLYERRREMLGAKIQRLPWEYQEVEYLEVGGTRGPYIKTGQSNQTGDTIIITLCILAYDIDSRMWGGLSPNSELDVYLNKFRFDIENPNTMKYYYSINEKYTIEKKEGKWYINGSYIQNAVDPNCDFQAYLFARNYAQYPQTVNKAVYLRIYKYTHKRGRTLLVEFVPCYRKSDNKPGMYDLVTKQFFTNAGTGDFTLGPNV